MGTILMSTITELAATKTAADKAYGEAFRAHVNTFKPLDPELFWDIIDVFSEEIQSRLKYGSPVADAGHNMFCLFVYQSRSCSDKTVWPDSELLRWEQMARFLARYSEVQKDLCRKMRDMPNLDRGDDSYGDLLDSLPLAGRKVCSDIMEDNIANNKQLEAAFEGPGMDPRHPLREFILHGENYITMKFEKVLMKSFLAVSRRDDDDDEREARPDPHVVLVSEPIKGSLFGVATGMKLTVRGPFLNGDEAEAYIKQEGIGAAMQIYRGVVKR